MPKGAKPNKRQKQAFKNVYLSDKYRTKKDAFKAAGYTDEVANTPTHIEKTKTWQQLLDQYLPEEKLTKKHHELLESENEMIADKALDKAYKLRGSYAPEKSVSVNYSEKREVTQHDDLKDKYEEELRKRLEE